MARLDTDRQSKLEPKRLNVALQKLKELGIIDIEQNSTTLKFKFKGEVVTFYPYSGWHAGKSIKDGRGLNELLTQLK